MWIFDAMRYNRIKFVQSLYLKGVPAKFQNNLMHIFPVISGARSSKLSFNPRHPSRNINCNHRHHLMQQSWRLIYSKSNNQKSRVDSDVHGDYKASSFHKLYILCRNETLWALLGHANGNIEMCSPPSAAIIMMVAAATIVRCPPVPI